jgi:hypothetical protein
MTDIPAVQQAGLRLPPARAGRALLLLGLLLELVMVAVGLWPAAWIVLQFAPRAASAWQWVLIILGAVLVFNYGYLIALLIVRIITPKPAEGHFPPTADGRPPREARRFMFNVMLAKARHDPPWAAMFSSVLTRIHPLRPLFTRYFGPRTESIMLGDTCDFLDPYLVEAGRDVVFGFRCQLVAHYFDNRGLYIRRIVIGDHAVIGGNATLLAGVEIGHHAVVASHSLVLPDTKIAPYEYWAGIPARKVKDLPRE